jgi:hypothetical protein
MGRVWIGGRSSGEINQAGTLTGRRDGVIPWLLIKEQ